MLKLKTNNLNSSPFTIHHSPFEAGWREALRGELEAPYFAQLMDFVAAERRQHTCYPPEEQVFRAFDSTPFHSVKVVILGQDPYHEEGQAMGLCFSVPQGVKVPPSLVNIIKELNADLGTQVPAACGDLSGWARQGVLLLNATLTVRAHQAGSHQGHGWERFTDAAIRALSLGREGLVFMLWGSYAIAKQPLIDASRHLVLTAPHPSPLSAYRGFFGCRHFSQANAWLAAHGQQPVEWGRVCG